jgi:hypothetical protein
MSGEKMKYYVKKGNIKMKVLLLDIDSKIPNLALKKIEKYHIDKGDEVIWNNKIGREVCV